MALSVNPERGMEPPEDVALFKCAVCGGGIYEGDWYYDIGGGLAHGDVIHEDWDCLREYMSGFLAKAEKPEKPDCWR